MATSLDSRAEKARTALFERYDQLNALWDTAEKQITKFHIPRPVCYEYDSLCHFDPQFGEEPYGGICLGVQKVKGEWRICHGYYHYNDPNDDHDWKPISECSAEIRVSAVDHIAELRQRVVETAEKFIPLVDTAIETLRSFVDTDIKGLLAERAKLNGRAK
jgi:hypothetical protein